MSTHLHLEGPDLTALLAQARDEHGEHTRVVRAERIRSGGVAGFFAKEHYEVTVEVPDGNEAPQAYTAEQGDGPTAMQPRSIGELLAAADAADGTDRLGSLIGTRWVEDPTAPAGAEGAPAPAVPPVPAQAQSSAHLLAAARFAAAAEAVAPATEAAPAEGPAVAAAPPAPVASAPVAPAPVAPAPGAETPDPRRGTTPHRPISTEGEEFAFTLATMRRHLADGTPSSAHDVTPAVPSVTAGRALPAVPAAPAEQPLPVGPPTAPPASEVPTDLSTTGGRKPGEDVMTTEPNGTPVQHASENGFAAEQGFHRTNVAYAPRPAGEEGRSEEPQPAPRARHASPAEPQAAPPEAVHREDRPAPQEPQRAVAAEQPQHEAAPQQPRPEAAHHEPQRENVHPEAFQPAPQPERVRQEPPVAAAPTQPAPAEHEYAQHYAPQQYVQQQYAPQPGQRPAPTPPQQPAAQEYAPQQHSPQQHSPQQHSPQEHLAQPVLQPAPQAASQPVQQPVAGSAPGVRQDPRTSGAQNMNSTYGNGVTTYSETPAPPRRAAAAAEHIDPQAAIRIAQDIPVPSPLRVGPGEVVLVVGEPDSVMSAGALVAEEIGSEAPVVIGRAEGHTSITAEQLPERVAQARGWSAPLTVSIPARPTAADADRAARFAARFRPSAVVVCVDATRRAGTAAELLNALRAVEAPIARLAVSRAAESTDPLEILSLGVPVGFLDGRAASTGGWVGLLLDAAMPADGPVGR